MDVISTLLEIEEIVKNRTLPEEARKEKLWRRKEKLDSFLRARKSKSPQSQEEAPRPKTRECEFSALQFPKIQMERAQNFRPIRYVTKLPSC